MPAKKTAAKKSAKTATKTVVKTAAKAAPKISADAPLKTLVIAEKPSVAADIARVLGGMTPVRGARGNDFFEGADYVVSSAVGHLLEIAAPEEFEVKRGKWSLANLPVIPDYFDLKPIGESAGRLKVLQKLYRRRDIKKIINACDAGREGELIFHNINRWLQNGKNEKSVQRLWLSSMTPTAIRDGFRNLRGDDEMESLKRAATCRNEADWLVGINATRAMTALHSAGGGFFLTTVGRVQTPTLAILVERERQIKAFIARDYWEARAIFAAAAGKYEGVWIHPKAEKTASKEERPERIFDFNFAQQIAADCKDATGTANEKKKPQSEQSPPLYDLTSLQRDANTRFHLPARATLGAAQALYERHRAITYPRTDSKALPEDYPQTVKKTLSALEKDSDVGGYAATILKNNWVVAANKRIFDNRRVSDHFAIIPTGETPKGAMKDIERKIYKIILTRFLSVFYPPAKYEVTERRTVVKNHVFLTKGKILLEAGWRAVGEQTPKDAIVAAITPGEIVPVDDLQIQQKKTQPPPRYNEATLLSAMEGAGKFVDDEALREAMKERGLGTPATRATIIEGLLRERYLSRDGRELIPMAKAHSLLRLLKALKIEALTLPSLTGEWEHKLRQIEKAKFNHEVFMEEIKKMTGDIVGAAKACSDINNVDGDYATLAAACPACGGDVKESHQNFSCVDSSSCGFSIRKTMASREFSVAEAEALLKNKATELLDGFRSKMGREFSAKVVLKENDKGQLATAFAFDKDDAKTAGAATAEEMQQLEALGNCPKCGAPVRDGGRYVCEKNIGDLPPCDFSFSRRILQREIPPSEMKKLLTDGRSGLLEGFISKKTGRPFKAILKLEAQTGKLQFEFAPRAKKGA